MLMNHPFILDALRTINLEILALENLKKNLGRNFIEACKLMIQCTGRIVMIGMGKSGHIASKIAATLASTGTPAFFVHPAEAGHGDFGMIMKSDVAVAVSNSGSTQELISLIPMIKHLGIPLISISNNSESILAKNSDVSLQLGIDKEACPHNLAPTSSTTATLVLGDAIAITLLKAKNFSVKDFANSHPSGSLGKRLILRVSDLMKTGKAMPVIKKLDTLEDAILEISSKGLGICLILNEKKGLEGVFTDGDLRRVFQSSIYNKDTKIANIMEKYPKTISDNNMAIEALHMMNTFKITALPVVSVSNNTEIVGVIHMHDLIREGIS